MRAARIAWAVAAVLGAAAALFAPVVVLPFLLAGALEDLVGVEALDPFELAEQRGVELRGSHGLVVAGVEEGHVQWAVRLLHRRHRGRDDPAWREPAHEQLLAPVEVGAARTGPDVDRPDDEHQQRDRDDAAPAERLHRFEAHAGGQVSPRLGQAELGVGHAIERESVQQQ